MKPFSTGSNVIKCSFRMNMFLSLFSQTQQSIEAIGTASSIKIGFVELDEEFRLSSEGDYSFVLFELPRGQTRPGRAKEDEK